MIKEHTLRLSSEYIEYVDNIEQLVHLLWVFRTINEYYVDYRYYYGDGYFGHCKKLVAADFYVKIKSIK